MWQSDFPLSCFNNTCILTGDSVVSHYNLVNPEHSRYPEFSDLIWFRLGKKLQKIKQAVFCMFCVCVCVCVKAHKCSVFKSWRPCQSSRIFEGDQLYFQVLRVWLISGVRAFVKLMRVFLLFVCQPE